MEAVDPWQVIRKALEWLDGPSSAPKYDLRGELRPRHDCGDPDCVSGALDTLLREALAAEPAPAIAKAKQALRDAALDFRKASALSPRDQDAMKTASASFEKAMSVLAAAGTAHPQDAAEHERWTARIKTLEDRAERAIALLRGESP